MLGEMMPEPDSGGVGKQEEHGTCEHEAIVKPNKRVGPHSKGTGAKEVYESACSRMLNGAKNAVIPIRSPKNEAEQERESG